MRALGHFDRKDSTLDVLHYFPQDSALRPGDRAVCGTQVAYTYGQSPVPMPPAPTGDLPDLPRCATCTRAMRLRQVRHGNQSRPQPQYEHRHRVDGTLTTLPWRATHTDLPPYFRGKR